MLTLAEPQYQTGGGEKGNLLFTSYPNDRTKFNNLCNFVNWGYLPYVFDQMKL